MQQRRKYFYRTSLSIETEQKWTVSAVRKELLPPGKSLYWNQKDKKLFLFLLRKYFHQVSIHLTIRVRTQSMFKNLWWSTKFRKKSQCSKTLMINKFSFNKPIVPRAFVICRDCGSNFTIAHHTRYFKHSHQSKLSTVDNINVEGFRETGWPLQSQSIHN